MEYNNDILIKLTNEFEKVIYKVVEPYGGTFKKEPIEVISETPVILEGDSKIQVSSEITSKKNTELLNIFSKNEGGDLIELLSAM